MTRLEFIEQYQNKINKILPEFKSQHYIDSDKIGCLFLDKWYYYDIDKCIKIIDITKEARAYIYNLKIGNKIKINSYGNTPDVEVIKISYKRQLDKRGNKIISTITTKEIFSNGGIYDSKVDIKDIIYKSNTYRDIYDSYLHTNGYFLNFSSYDIDLADKVIVNYEGVK